MGMVMLPPGVTWEQYTEWLKNTPEGQQYSQYINQAGAGNPVGVSHAPPMQFPGQFRPFGSPPAPAFPQPAPLSFQPVAPPPESGPQQTLEEQWRNAQPGRAQPIQPPSQGTPLRPPAGENPPVSSPPQYPYQAQSPQPGPGHQYDPWAGAVRAPGQPLNKSGPSIGATKYIGRDGNPLYAR